MAKQSLARFALGVSNIVLAGSKQAALAQYQRLVELKSNLAAYLLEEINAMKDK